MYLREVLRLFKCIFHVILRPVFDAAAPLLAGRSSLYTSSLFFTILNNSETVTAIYKPDAIFPTLSLSPKYDRRQVYTRSLVALDH